MKKFYLLFVLLVAMLSSCATASYASKRTVNEMDEISYVLANYYPQLHEYYMEGVLEVDSMKEVTLLNGDTEYKVKYHFIKYYYRNQDEMLEVLRNGFPELYEMFVSGVIEIRGIYKYVDKESGVIRNHVMYRRIYDFYYERTPLPYPYNHTRLIYRPRPMPLQPAPPRPRPQPNVRPNNPPQQRPNHGGGPGNRPGRGSGPGGRGGRGR